jgi:hypothetical protein
VVWHEGERVEYWQVGFAGGNRRVVRAPHTPRRVDAERVADFKRANLDLLGELRSRAELAQIAQMLDEGTYFHTVPAISDLLLDPDGNTWLGRYSSLPGRSTQWEVFDSRGVWLGTVATPNGLGVAAIGMAEVLGTYQDADGVMSVRVHQLRKP